MANILIATTPASGHVNPMIVLAQELVNRGHQIWWYTGQVFQSKIEDIGANYKQMYQAYDFSGMTREEAFPQTEGLEGISNLIENMKSIFIEQAPKQMVDILEILTEFPADLLVGDDMCYGLGFVHEKTGIPLVNISNSIYIYSSRDTAPIGLGLPSNNSLLGKIGNTILNFISDHLILRKLRTEIDNTRTRSGLTPIRKSIFESISQPPNLYLLGTVPEFEYPRSDLYEHAHFVGAFINTPVRNFNPPVWWHELESDRPVILVTQGTIANNNLNNLIIPTVQALANQDILVIVTTGGTPVENIKLDPLPNNVRVEKFIPYHFLLPQVDIMITNGGYGGVQMALFNGVPLIVAGSTEEKADIAARVNWGGVGINLKQGKPSEAAICRAVKIILQEPKYKHQAQKLQAIYQNYNAPQQAADLSEKIITKNAGNLSLI